MFETVQSLLRSRAADDTPAVVYGDRTWTWRQHLAEASAEAAAMIGLADPARPLHVGALLTNSPAMLRAMAAAALGGYVLCGLNTTRRGDGLLSDIRRSDCQLLLVDPQHQGLLDGLDLSDLVVFDVTSSHYRDTVDSAAPLVLHREVGPHDPFMMIFTSGTSGSPKAVPNLGRHEIAGAVGTDFEGGVLRGHRPQVRRDQVIAALDGADHQQAGQDAAGGRAGVRPRRGQGTAQQVLEEQVGFVRRHQLIVGHGNTPGSGDGATGSANRPG